MESMKHVDTYLEQVLVLLESVPGPIVPSIIGKPRKIRLLSRFSADLNTESIERYVQSTELVEIYLETSMT